MLYNLYPTQLQIVYNAVTPINVYMKLQQIITSLCVPIWTPLKLHSVKRVKH